MITSISSSLSQIVNQSIPSVFVSNSIQRCAKIAGIVLAIFGALATLCLIFHHHKISQQKAKKNDLPPHINPHSSQEEIPPPSRSNLAPPMSDEEYAKLLQAEFDLDDDEPFIEFTLDNGSRSGSINPPEKVAPSSAIAPASFTQIEEICGEIAEKTFIDPSFSAVNAIGRINAKTKEEILNLLNEVVAEFESRFSVCYKIKYKGYVPEYFANVHLESMDDRKYRSLAGIRNLYSCGPSIIDDFRDQKYLGGEDHYSNMKGLKAFKYYTGNAVDLDTEIDAQNDTEARQIAEKMIVEFGKTCGIGNKYRALIAADVAQNLPHRKLHLPGLFSSIHDVQGSHTDRSNHGVWKRLTPQGIAHYYVNVPNCDVVLLATLRLPYMLAELTSLTKQYKGGILLKEFYDTLFNEGLSDKCFNDKAREFLNFYHMWKAKLEDVPTPEEDARRKIAQGAFGEALKEKSIDAVMREAYDRAKLNKFLADLSGSLENCTFDSKFLKASTPPRNLDEWLEDEEETIIAELKNQGLWENVLYRTEEGKDYFLLNQGVLRTFLKEYYTSLVF